jgi:PAS domain S-box-containing protein
MLDVWPHPGLDGRESYRGLRLEPLYCAHRPSQELLHMTGSIHRGTASEPQDRSSGAAHSIEVPPEIVRKWQEFVNLLAEIMHVPSASIMRVDPPHIKVFVSSTSKGNPCEPGALDTGPYCETVMKTGQPLLVPDALENEAWKTNAQVRLGMISYLGFPIGWPDGRLFGTICVRDNKRNEFSEAYLKLLLHFRDILQADLKSLVRLHGEIEEREAKIRRFVDANIIGIFIWDLEGRIIDANEAFLRIVGYDREDLDSGRMRWPSLTPAELHASNERTLTELKATGTVQPCEREYLRKDGCRVPVLMGSTLFEESGNEGLAFVLDLTERKRAEEALRGSEAKFRDYAESAADWYWETDPDHKFTRVTDYERRLALGLSPTSRIGLVRWKFAADVESEPEKWELHRSMLEARQPFRDFVYQATRSDGSLAYYKTSGKPVFDANGEFLGYRGTGTDVTALRTAEAEARENEQRYRKAELELAHANRVATMGQLTASITHEVNQPITAAVTYALAARHWLSAEPPNLHEVDDALSLVVKEGKRAREVVERIRALIKKVPTRRDAVAMDDTILEVIALVRTDAANSSVSVRTQFAEGLPRVQGDRVQLQQVMLNLIVNAIQSMGGIEDGNRELHISTASIEPEGVCVAVRDTGNGLHPESLPRLFEPFYTTKPDGMGMGLSICRSIIEAHGGRLWATRCEPRGALFQFTIPADCHAL